MLNILINAYAVSPNWGSEQGMGWNWVANLAKYCNVFVITEGEFREHIEAAVAELPQGKNMHFYYNPLPDKVRRMCWNQGDWRFYWYYRKWQKKTLDIAKGIIAEHHIDILHQLNMIGFREPGYLWKIKDIPFVWGPIGGMELMPVAYLHGAGWKTYMKNKLKNVINSWQMHHQPRVLKAIGRADYLIAATGGAYNVLHDYHRKSNVVLINETGCNVQLTPSTTLFNNEYFNILWVGKFDFRKQLSLAIDSIAAMSDKRNVRLHIVGENAEAIAKPYKDRATRKGIKDRVIWHGKVAHSDVLALMKHSDVLLFTSINEGTPHVVLEAIQECLPIVCFHTCGQGEVVDDSVGMKVEFSNPTHSAKQFAEALDVLSNDRLRLAKLKDNCVKRSQELSWEKKTEQMIEIYKEIGKDEKQRHNGSAVGRQV